MDKEMFKEEVTRVILDVFFNACVNNEFNTINARINETYSVIHLWNIPGRKSVEVAVSPKKIYVVLCNLNEDNELLGDITRKNIYIYDENDEHEKVLEEIREKIEKLISKVDEVESITDNIFVE